MMEILEYTFFRYALYGILLISLSCGLIGTYIMTRRMVFLSGGITHACFGGLGMGYWLGVSPVVSAALFAVAGALGVEWLNRRNIRNDSAIAVIWAAGMALGTIFVFLTPGYVPELNSFLFGNVLTISVTDLWIFAVFSAVTLAVYLTLYPYIVAVSFDAPFARTRRLPVTTLNVVMTVLTSLSIVLTIKMIGIMLLISMMTLPQITTEIVTHRYRPLMWGSVAISALCGTAGLFLSYFIAVPASAAIVMLMIMVFVIFKSYNALKTKYLASHTNCWTKNIRKISAKS